jgi:hypothetical protein
MAIVAAWALQEHLRSSPRWMTWEKIAAALHWIGIAFVVTALPLAGAVGWTKMMTIEGGPWFSWPIAATGLVAMVALLAVGIGIWLRGQRMALLIATALVIVAAQAMYQYGFSRDEAGVSDMRVIADYIHHTAPDATLFSSYGPDKPGIVFMPAVDLSIYLNRTVTRLDDRAALAQANNAQVVLSVARRGEIEPIPPPNSRTLVSRDRRNGERWRVYLIPPRSQ